MMQIAKVNLLSKIIRNKLHVLQSPQEPLLTTKRGTAMPRLYLEVVGNLAYRCSDSSPRYMRENHYAI